LRVEPEPREPRGDRPEGATPPSQRDTAPSGTVYHWPDPRGGWDEPPVWEDVVAPQEDPDDDGGDEELWRGTAFAWNLEPTEPGADASADGADAAEASDQDAAPTPPTAGIADDGKPFSTTPAAAHVNASAARERTSRSRPAKEPREKTPRTPREKTPRTPREKTPRAPRGRTAPPAPAPRSDRAASVGSATEPPSITALAAPSPDRTRSRRRLLIALIALGVVVVLAALAVVGYRITAGNDSDASAPAPVATTPSEEASAAPTAEPTAELPTVGPLPAGTYAWSDLLGGECLQPFDSVWAEEFTVVDCATAHTGEMVATAQLTEEAFPGQDALALSVATLCQATGVVDVLGAEAYGDVQVSASFPVTQEQWDSGERRYFCFVDRAGGGELIGALTGTPAG
ncbi:septum formation family protein, partial [Rathayibacter sp. ZW T2_19]